MPKDMQQIVEEWLRANGYGGLFNNECGCTLGDMMPCGGPSPRCAPGFRHTPEECQQHCEVCESYLAQTPHTYVVCSRQL